MNHFAIANKSIYTSLEYDVYGLPAFVKTGHSYPGSTNIQYLETNFDSATENLTWRKDRKRDLTENFTYDPVHKNRLASWQVQGQQPYSSTYNNANGNILTKTDFTSYGNPYSYGLNAGPHAVTGVTAPLLMPAEAQQEIQYNSFNKASLISHNYQRRELFLHYGPDEQRIKTEYKINGQPTLTRYFPGGGLEVEVSANGSERWLHYLPGGGLYVCDKEFNKIGMYYVLTDYLGSWDKVISETGSPIEEYSFDPWGRRRNPVNWTYSGVPSSFIFDRGYTGHEMLDAFGLVNMNGRMYDPVLGRMLSPDNYVSSAGSTQAFNRYSYALNNPLIITDPSGDHPALIAMIAYSAIVGGLSSAKNGDGFLQGFGTGVATGALSYGVGAAIGPVVSGSTVWANMANAGIHTAIAGGMTYGVDALVNNTAFNWKAYGLNIATSMAMAGLTYEKPSYEYNDSNSSFEIETKDLTRSESLSLISAFNDGNTENVLEMRLEYQVLNEETTGCKITSKLVRKNIMKAKYGLSKNGKILNWNDKEVVGGFYNKSVITISPFNVNYASHAELEGILLHEYVHHMQLTGKWLTDITHIMGNSYMITTADLEVGAYYISYLHSKMSGLPNASGYLSASQSWAAKSKAPFFNPANYDPIIRRLSTYRRY